MENLRISGISKLKEHRAVVMRTLPTLDNPLSHHEFSSLRLAPKYQELQKRIHEFRHGDKWEDSLGYNKELHKSLQRLVTEVEFTKPKELQHRFLEKVHSWYQHKLNSKTGTESISKQFKSNSSLNTAASTQRTRENSLQDGFTNTTRSQLTERSVRSTSVNDYRDVNTSSPSMHKSTLARILSNTLVNQVSIKEIDEKIKTACVRGSNLFNLHKSVRSELRSWSVMKARRDEQFARKYEYNKLSSRPELRTFDAHTRSKSESKLYPETKHLDFRDKFEERPVTDTSKQARVDVIRQLFKLQVPTDNLEGSAYNSNHTPTSLSSKHDTNNSELNDLFNTETPISSLKSLNLTHKTVLSDRFSQIVQVENIKRRFAKKSITCSSMTLHRALVAPEDISPEKLSTDFPEHGKLISNPLFEKFYSRKATNK